MFQARYNRSELGPSHVPPVLPKPRNPSVAPPVLPKPNPPMQQPPYGPYDPSGQKDLLYSIAPTVPPQQYYQPMPPKEDYPPELNRPNVIPEPEEPINIPDDMTMCPVPSCRTLNLKKSFACKKCRMGLQSPSLDIVNPEVRIIPGIIPVEKWNCSACSCENATAQGRPRICEMCTTNNSMPAPDVSPQPPSQHYDPTQDKGRLYPNPSYQNLNPSYQNRNPSYQNLNPSYQNLNPSYQNLNPSYQNLNPSYPDPTPTGSKTVPEVPVDHFDEELWDQVKLLAENPQEIDSKASIGPLLSSNPNLPYHPSMNQPQPPPPDNLPYKKIKHLISETHLTYKDEVLQLALEKCGM